VPKQYCPLFDHGETMLERTMRRVALSVRPQRTATVVVRSHRQFYEPVAASGQTGALVVQPENRGTAPAVLYGLGRLAHQVQLDAVAIFPTDHYVDNDRRFMRHVDLAFAAVQAAPGVIILLGIVPTAAEV
jgi:mannose-1-phosphate guanylyltransferase